MKILVGVLLGALLLFNVASAIAQEAVTETPTSPQSEETATEGPTVTTTPAEHPRQKTSRRKSGSSLRDMMTREEFEAMGLDKLTPGELEHLTWWLQEHRRGAARSTAPAGPAAAAAGEATTEAAEGGAAGTAGKKKIHYPWLAKKQTIYSRVDGALGPLTGRSIITLEDGTKWHQANSDDRYRPEIKDHPAAAVLPTSFGWKMRIEGMPDFYVNPVSE
jgi:hypothetical protein